MLTTLVDEMRRQGAKCALECICWGSSGIAVILEGI